MTPSGQSALSQYESQYGTTMPVPMDTTGAPAQGLGVNGTPYDASGSYVGYATDASGGTTSLYPATTQGADLLSDYRQDNPAGISSSTGGSTMPGPAGSVLGGSNIGGGGLDPNTGFGLGGTSSQQTGTSVGTGNVGSEQGQSTFSNLGPSNTGMGAPIVITDAASYGYLAGGAIQIGLKTAGQNIKDTGAATDRREGSA